jgi:hypothetical protein
MSNDLFPPANNNQPKEKEYITTDLWRAAFLRVFGWRLKDVREGQNGRNQIVLTDHQTQAERDAEADKIMSTATEFANAIRRGDNYIDIFRNREVLVEPNRFIAEYRAFKNEFEQLKANSHRR